MGLSLMPGATTSGTTMTVTFQGHYESHPEVVTIGESYCGYRPGGDRTPEQVNFKLGSLKARNNIARTIF
jgi:hypothetical protein